MPHQKMMPLVSGVFWRGGQCNRCRIDHHEPKTEQQEADPQQRLIVTTHRAARAEIARSACESRCKLSYCMDHDDLEHFSSACPASLRARRIVHTVFAFVPCAISLKNALGSSASTALWNTSARCR